MKAGELARAAGVNFETLRFYEKVKVLPEPRRLPNGYRFFNEEHLKALRFVQSARELGFKLEEIRRMLGLKARGSRCAEVAQMASSQLDSVRAKIASLRTLERRLLKLVDS